MASDDIMVAALGRPFTLGALYDARKDHLIQGFQLWDEASLQKKIDTICQRSSAFQITTSDSIESKSSLLDINASLKASILTGLVEVGGSAKYLNDAKKFKNLKRLTFQYQATTHTKKVSVIDLETKKPKQIKVYGSATHVVTGILYGANAFFVFESDKLDDSSVQDIQGRMEAVVTKIPRFNVEGKVEITLTEEDKKLTDKMSCRFYGDFILDKNPATFEGAVKTYIELPKLLGQQGENSVPLKVWLMPLKNLDPDAAEVLSEVSDGLMDKVQEALDDFREIEMRCNNSLYDPIMEKFPLIQKELKTFERHCSQLTSNFLRTVANKLPSIREGKEDESSAKQFLEDRRKSPFIHKLSNWLEDIEREVNVIKSCVGIMKGIKIVQSKSELDREVLAAGVEEALCFVFTSLESTDPGINTATNYLESHDRHPGDDVWYHSNDVYTKMREKAQKFHSFAQRLKNKPGRIFLIAAIANEKHEGASIYQYMNGILLTDDYIIDVTNVTYRKDVVVYACDLTLDPDTAHNNLSLSEGGTKATYGKLQQYPHRPERFSAPPQVLCKEGLTGRCYWEVEVTGELWRVGVCYKGMPRKELDTKSILGCYTRSWCLGKRPFDGSYLIFMHADDGDKIPVNLSGFRRLGVYLDWSAGTLSYYQVSSDTLSHIYTFYTDFTEPVYPGFLVAEKCSIQFIPCSVNV